MLKGLLFLALIYLCQGYMNSRLQNWFQEKRQIGFLPAAAGIDSDSGKPRGLAPYPQPWRQADRRGLAPYPQLWRQADRRGLAPYPQPWRQADRRGPAPFLQPRRQADSRQPPDHPNHDNSHFCPMPGMVQRGARLIEDYNAYPWLARVLHVRWDSKSMSPMICTAAGIKKRIFITAARCIATAKPYYTKVLIGPITQLQALTFVTPSPPTKQLFDDIGIIVTYFMTKDRNGVLRNASFDNFLPIPHNPRTAERYWFQDWAADATYKIVGFIAPEDSPSTQNLYELGDMYGDNSLCNKILPMEDNSEDYWTACVHSCDAQKHSRNSTTCHRYLFGLGHLVLDNNDQLVGIVTWTCGNNARDRARRGDLPLPVGVAVPDARFDSNLKCAEKLNQQPIDDYRINEYLHSTCN